MTDLDPTAVTGDDHRASDTAKAAAIDGVWEHHPDEAYRRDLSHWRGHGRWDESSWTVLVSTTARRLGELFSTHDRSIGDSRPTALDWGCGGGAGLVALAPSCSRLYGVDVSAKNIAESRRQIRELGTSAPPLTTIIAGADPSVVATSIGEPIDVFLSISTFHLLPEKALGTEILRTAYAVMAPGGLGYVTIRYDDGTPRYEPRPGYERYLDHHVFASSWQISEFWELLEHIAFTPTKVAYINTQAHFCSFFFTK